MPSNFLRRWLPLVLILWLATGLRFFRIEYQSYWNDEGNSRALTHAPIPAIIASAAADIHPPSYYLLLSAWQTALGESELALRGFSALAGVVLVALLYRLGRLYFDEAAALGAALLGAVNPFLIYYSQEARMYALLATLSAASMWMFSAWLKSSRAPAPPYGKVVYGLSYGLISALGLYTHYAFPFVIIAQNLAAAGGLLFHRHGQNLRRYAMWLALQAGTLILFLPWLPIAVRQLTTWPSAREFHPLPEALAEVGRYLAFGRTLPIPGALLVFVGLGLLLSLAYRGQTITPLLWLLVPVGLTLGVGLLSEAFSKFLLVAVPPVCLLLGHSLTHLLRQPFQVVEYNTPVQRRPHMFWPFGWGVLSVGAIGLATYFSLDNLYFNPIYFRDDYRGIARYIEQLARPGDAIITLAPNQIQAFAYYHSTGAPIYPLPHTRPLDPAETVATLESLAQKHTRLFVLFWGEPQADPEHLIKNWLSANTFKAGDQWYRQVQLATYATARMAAQPATTSGAQFGPDITLMGYTLGATRVAPGDILQVTLFWKTARPLTERYKVFVHLYADPAAPPIAQQDGEPGGGQRLTLDWPPATAITDNHGILIPPDLPPGQYSLVIGLYELFAGSRLPITLDGKAMRDQLLLETVIIH